MKIGPIAGMLIALLLASPGFAQRLPDSPFGVVCPWSGLKSMGIRWVRSGAGASSFDWRNHEKARGQYDFSGSDGEINGVGAQEELGYLVLLGYTPEWASSGPRGECGYPPKDLADWRNYVFQIVSHFKDRVKYWEVWNEQDIGFFQGTLDDYVAMLRTAYIAAHQADPDCKVVFGGMAGINLPFLERAYQLGAGPYFDIMAVHPYQWGDRFSDDWFISQHQELRQLMTRYGDPQKEIWLTELGWSTGDAGITQEVQARMLVQCMITCLSLRPYGVTRYFWFVVKDWGGPGHGLLDTDGKRKLSAKAYAALTGKLTGADYVGKADLGDKVRCHLFRPQGEKTKLLAVLWSTDKKDQPVKLDMWAVARIWDMYGSFQSAATTLTKATPNPVYILVDSSAFKGKIIAAKGPSKASPKDWTERKDVWAQLVPQAGTSRAWFARGLQEEAAVIVHNDSGAPAAGTLELRLAKGSPVTKDFRLAAGKKVKISVRLPIPERPGLANLEIRGKADGKEMVPLSVPVRISRGPVIEFLANSSVERPYFYGNEPGGAPSVRFGGSWVYQFDLSGAKLAQAELNVGAHNAGAWKVLAGTNGTDFEPLISGKSNRSWHAANLDRFAGRRVFLKFEGQDVQLGELVLSTVAK